MVYVALQVLLCQVFLDKVQLVKPTIEMVDIKSSKVSFL
ncbi:hypothetical protein J567_4546, partial [Acinetobacter baumannii 754286]